MKKATQLKHVFLVLLIPLLILQCDDDSEIKDVLEVKYETSNSSEVLERLSGIQNRKQANGLQRSEGTDVFVTVDVDELHLETLTNSDAMITVVPATLTQEPEVYSRVLALDIEGQMRTAVFSMYPDDSDQNNGFNGHYVSYTLDGEPINAFRVQQDTIVARIVLPRDTTINIATEISQRTDGSCNCDDGALPDCCFEEHILDAVIIIAHTGGIPPDELYNPRDEDIDFDVNAPVTFLAGGSGTLPEDDDEADCLPNQYYDYAFETCLLRCPLGYQNDGNDNCVRVIPCEGDPLPNPEIAAQTNSGINGGRYGNTRSGGKQFHGGLDLKSEKGTPIYAIFDGNAQSITKFFKKAGWIVYQTAVVNGETISIQYFHLQETNRVSGNIRAGDIIGYLGDSGNLKNAISQGLSVSHLHIKMKNGNGETINPEDYITTKFDNNGNPIENDCN